MNTPQPSSNDPIVDVVVLAFGDEPLLGECVASILKSQEVNVRLVVVDNGCTSGLVDVVAYQDEFELITPSANLGFTGGCNMGASVGDSPFVAFVNSDAIVAPDALRKLVDALQSGSDAVTGLVEMYQAPDVVNAAGNPVHWTGISWAGGLGQSSSRFRERRDVASVSGALMAITRDAWEALGGFNETYFAYGEDSELSLRCWLSGFQVTFEPSARARHFYEFSRNPQKFFLLERNRLFTLLTLFQWRTLILLSPGLLLFEFGILVACIRDGWFNQKLKASTWIFGHWSTVMRRRRAVQAQRCTGDAELLKRLELEIEPGDLSGIQVPRVVNRVLASQGRIARRWASRKI